MHLIIRSLGTAGDKSRGILGPGNQRKTPPSIRVWSITQWYFWWGYMLLLVFYCMLSLPILALNGTRLTEAQVSERCKQRSVCVSGGSADVKTSLGARFWPRSRSSRTQGWIIKTKINLDFALCCFVQNPDRVRVLFLRPVRKEMWKERGSGIEKEMLPLLITLFGSRLYKCSLPFIESKIQLHLMHSRL